MVHVDLDAESRGTAVDGTSDGSAARGVCEAFPEDWGATHLLQRLVERRQWSIADRVEVRFRGSKDDHLRKGAKLLTRAREGPPKHVGEGGGAVDLMVGLLSCYLLLPPSAPLVAFDCGSYRWSMWTQAQAARALRQVV